MISVTCTNCAKSFSYEKTQGVIRKYCGVVCKNLALGTKERHLYQALIDHTQNEQQ